MRCPTALHCLLLGAGTLCGCQTIIGISNYRIDSELDGAAGEASAGGNGAGGSGEAGAPGGAAGAPEPEPEPECTTEEDCDDTIGCTVDACEEGVCTHTPDRTRCLPEAAECMDCQLNIGCVSVPPVVQELLLDPSLDNAKGEWDEYSDHNKRNLFVEEGAQSGTRIARLGPSPTPQTIEEYADLSQLITIPENAKMLRFTGYYRLVPGTLKVASDYAAAALYAIGELNPELEFHSWQATDGAQDEWKPFSYEASGSKVLSLQGQDVTFDVIAHVFESVYRFDTLSLQATSCE